MGFQEGHVSGDKNPGLCALYRADLSAFAGHGKMMSVI